MWLSRDWRDWSPLSSIDIYRPRFIWRYLFTEACADGDIDTVRQLVKQGCDPNTSGGLHITCEHGHVKLVRVLIEEYGCNPRGRDGSGNTPLHVACRKGATDVVRYLTEQKKCDQTITNHDRELPLHLACARGNLDIVKLVAGCEVHACTKEGDTPLHVACREGATKTVRYLTEQKKCDQTITNHAGELPLHVACVRGNLDIVKLIAGCKVHACTKKGDTPLHVACREGATDIVRYLTEQKKCDQTITNHAGELPLHVACVRGNLDIVKLIAGCKVHACTKKGDTPLHVACREGATDIVRYLTEQKKCDQTITNHAGELPLHVACVRGNLDIVKLIAGCKVHACTKKGDTPLHVACREGATDIVRYLTEQKKCDQTIKNHAGELPLHVACVRGNLDIVKLIAGCKVHACTKKGDTPLHVACREGATDIVRYLTEQKKCDQTIKNHAGELPLHLACAIENLNIVKLVADCDVNTCTTSDSGSYYCVKKGDTPLHVACREGATDIVRYLTEQKKCDQTIKNHAGQLPLHVACARGNLDIVKLVADCDVNTCYSTTNEALSIEKGDTPLHVACREGATKTVRYLTEQKKCDQTITNHAGELPLHVACVRGNLDFVKLVADCDVNTCTTSDSGSYYCVKKGDTPLHVACREGATDIVRYLTEQKKCDQTIKNHAGQLPLHVACARGNLDIVKLVADCDVNTCYSTTNEALSIEKGDTPLHVACREGATKTVRYLTEQKKFDQTITNHAGELPLHVACVRGNLDIVKLVADCDVNTCTTSDSGSYYCVKKGDTPLHVACREGATDIVRYLTEQKRCDQTIKNHAGQLPLHVACARGNLDIVKLVADCDVNTCYSTTNEALSIKKGDTPLHVACREGATKTVRYLTEQKKFDQTITNHAGELPLHVACVRGNLDIVKLVADCDVNTCITSDSGSYYCVKKGDTPLHVACREGATDIVRYLTEQKKCDQTIKNHAGQLPLHVACARGNLDIVKLVADCDVNTCTPSNSGSYYCVEKGDTPLHVACREGATKTVRYLTEQKKCDQTITNHAGELPLHVACVRGNLDIVKLVADCDVNTCTTSDSGSYYCVKKGDTPLHVACREGAIEIVRYLTEQKKCDQTITNHAGELPLHVACVRGNLDIVKLIAGCEVHACTKKGDTPLHVACREGATEIVRYLTEQKKCDQTITNHAGQLPLHLACARENLDIVKLVADCDVDTFTTSNSGSYYCVENGDTPLHVACREGATDIVRYLTEQKKCDQTITNHAGQLPLHIACRRGNLNIVKLVADCDVNTCTKEGDTPLHVACRVGTAEIVRYLTEQILCSRSIRNHAGQLPLHVACARGNPDIAIYLKDVDLEAYVRVLRERTLVREKKQVRTHMKKVRRRQAIANQYKAIADQQKVIMEQVKSAIRSKSTIPVRIVKLLFNGSPRVGKSSLMRKLAGILREDSPSTGVANAPLKVTIKRISQSVAQVSGLTWTQLGLGKEVATLLAPLLVETTSIARESHGDESSDGQHSIVSNLTDIQAHPTEGFLHDTSEEDMVEAATDPLQGMVATLMPDDLSILLQCRNSLPDYCSPLPTQTIEVPIEKVALPTAPQIEMQAPTECHENLVSECASCLPITHHSGSQLQLNIAINTCEGMFKQETLLDCKNSTPASLNHGTPIEETTIPDLNTEILPDASSHYATPPMELSEDEPEFSLDSTNHTKTQPVTSVSSLDSRMQDNHNPADSETEIVHPASILSESETEHKALSTASIEDTTVPDLNTEISQDASSQSSSSSTPMKLSEAEDEPEFSTNPIKTQPSLDSQMQDNQSSLIPDFPADSETEIVHPASETESRELKALSTASNKSSSRISQPLMPSKSSVKRSKEASQSFEALFNTSFLGDNKEKVKELMSDSITIHLVDTGGQPEFHEILPALVSGPAANLLLFKLNDELQEQQVVEYHRPDRKPSQPYVTSYTSEDVIFRTLATIMCFSRCSEEADDGPEAAVLLIGTHKDRISSDLAVQSEKIRKIDDLIRCKLEQTEFYTQNLIQFLDPHSHQVVVPVDNTESCEEKAGILALRKLLNNVFQERFQEVDIPPTWLVFDLALRKSGVSTISYAKCYSIAQVCGIESEEELRNALWYLHHHVGVLMHFPDVLAIKHLVIVDLQFLFDHITDLIMNTFTEDKVGPFEHNLFKRKGQFLPQRIAKQTHGKHDPLSLDKLIKLLEYLHIIVCTSSQEKPKVNKPQKHHYHQQRRYFMPCVLPYAEVEGLKCPQSDSHEAACSPQPSPLLVRFDCGFCLIGVFCTLIVWLLSKGSEVTDMQWRLSEEEDDKLCRNMITFKVGKSYDKVTIIAKTTYYEIWFKRQPGISATTSVHEMCSYIQETIDYGISAVVQALNYSYRSAHKFGFYCPRSRVDCYRGCSDSKSPHHLAMCDDPDDPDDPLNMVCLISDKPSTIPPNCSVWYGREMDPKAKLSDAAELRHVRVDNTQLSLSNLGEVMNEVCRVNKWFNLGLGVGLHFKTLERIKIENREAISDCLTYMLRAFLLEEDDVKKAGGATWQTIVNALSSPLVNEPRLAEEIAKKHRRDKQVRLTRMKPTS